MADQMSGAAMAMPPDPKAAFKQEWESLEVVQHQWALRNVEAELLGLSSAAVAGSNPQQSHIKAE